MSKIEGKYAPQWLKVRRFGSVRTCSPEIFWSPNLNLNLNRTLRSVQKVWVRTEVLDRTSAMLVTRHSKDVWTGQDDYSCQQRKIGNKTSLCRG